MRKILLSLLLATAVAAPATAQRGDPDRRVDRSDRSERPDREERQQARAERQQARAERQQARPENFGNVRRQRPDIDRDVLLTRPVEARSSGGLRQTRSFGGDVMRARPADQARRSGGIRETRPFENDVVRERSLEDARATRGLRETRRPLPNVFRNRVPVVSNVPRDGTQPPVRVERRHGDVSRWNTNWRNDRRHDWRRWRDHNRSQFHVGIYYDPFGWGYRPYSVGWRMWPSYYGSRYTISDPWQYRLPYAPPGYRWIRYWDDAILVDSWNGQVVDVIRNFFW